MEKSWGPAASQKNSSQAHTSLDEFTAATLSDAVQPAVFSAVQGHEVGFRTDGNRNPYEHCLAGIRRTVETSVA